MPSLRGIASTYFWGYVLVNEDMPALTAAEAAGLASNTRFVFLVPRAQDVERARQSLRKYDLDFSVVAREDFGAGERALSVVLADLVRLPGDHTS